MKKVLIWIPLLGLVALGYYNLRNVRMEFRSTRGETATVRRGDLTIPIDAAGKVIPKSRREIKAEASGEVEEVLVKAGDVIKAGDILLRLKRDDEERNVRRAEQELKRAETNLSRAKVVLEERKTSGLQAARARLEALNGRMIHAEADYRHKEDLFGRGEGSELEYSRAKSVYEELKAQIEQAKADVQQANMAVELAEKDVALAEAAVETAKTTQGDARKRLEKTDIVAPVDGMVSQILAEEGEVIQGGKTTITGGTLLAVLADWSVCYVRAEVDEADVGDVLELAPAEARPGGNRYEDPEGEETPIEPASNVKITVEAFRDEEFEGTIERIYPEPKSGSSVVTYLVDIEVTSENRHLLMSSMQADVVFTAKSVYDAVLVPHDAIKRNPNNELGVYLQVKNERGEDLEPEFAKCRVGLDNGVYAQVIEGVKEGDVVFTKLPQKTEKEREDEERRGG
ncbi:MAG: biotin/lipoyl-binding protein [Phycisphaerales bacterium]|nr:MAG: biotin/lipoyl-binding protein [Phycisphaerales bacterium]